MNNARSCKNQDASTRGARRGGFTLIEILIALVIFVVGALAIVRIFPGALGVIQNSENRTVATNLSRGTLASYDNDPNLIPDGVYDTDLTFEGASFVGSINTNNALPADGKPDSADFNDSALGHFKRIQGERQRVLADGSGGPNYVLTQFPYNWGTGNLALIYVEDRVEGVRVYTGTPNIPANSGLLDFSNARLASDGRAFNDVDYKWANGSVGTRNVTPGIDRKRAPREWMEIYSDPPNIPAADLREGTLFYATYNWSDGGRIQGVIDEPTASKATQLKAANLSGKQVIDGPISLRVRRLVATWNPTAITTRADAMRGYLPLNITDGDSDVADLDKDSSAFVLLSYPSVSLTYNVSDWRWMVEDTVITSGSGDYTDVAVPTRFIDAENLNNNLRGSQAGDGSVFALTTALPDNSATPPTSATLGSARWDGANPNALNPAAPNNSLFSVDDSLVDAKKGLVHFDTRSGDSRRARIVYWTTDQWARQLSVAAKSYVPFYAGAGSREEWREYVWDGAGNLYFRPSEVGKSVIVTFEYDADPGVGTNFETKTAPMTIEDEPVDRVSTPVNAAFGNSRVARLQFNDPTSGGAYDVRAIRSIRGASVMVRTAWADGSKYQQEVASTYRPLDEN